MSMEAVIKQARAGYALSDKNEKILRLRKAFEAGFDAYLVKPVRSSRLLDCLKTAIGPKAVVQPMPRIARHASGRSEDQQRLRILVADDNATNQAVALAMLERRGYRCEAVANGERP